ncbi:MAG: ComF family protein [Geminicoccales bacterium]
MSIAQPMQKAFGHLPDMILPHCCLGCAVTPPLDDRVRAVLRDDDGSRGMILRVNHVDRTDIARIFGRLMAHAGRDLFEEVDLIGPFPLHRWRLLQCGYNQAAMSAEFILQASGVPMLPDALQQTTSIRS